MNIIIETLLELAIPTLFIMSPIILDKINKKMNSKERKQIKQLTREARMHVEAYKTKKMIDYYSTINQGVVSLPAFIEAKKAMESKRHELY